MKVADIDPSGRTVRLILLYYGDEVDDAVISAGQTYIYHSSDRIGVYPGKSVDMDEYFEGWSDDALKERYDLVKEFDQMVDDCIAQFKYLLDNFRIVEKVVPCTRTMKVIEPIAEEE